MRAKEFLESEVVNLQQWKREKDLPVFDVSYDDLYRNFIHLVKTGDKLKMTMDIIFAIAEELHKRGKGPKVLYSKEPLSRDNDRKISDQEKYDQAVKRQQGKDKSTDRDALTDYMDLERADTPTLEKFGVFLLDLRDKLEAEGKDY